MAKPNNVSSSIGITTTTTSKRGSREICTNSFQIIIQVRSSI